MNLTTDVARMMRQWVQAWPAEPEPREGAAESPSTARRV
jgi:hypothetical protein